MITLTDLSHSAARAREGRLLYEDLAFVAHLTELDRHAAHYDLRRRNVFPANGLLRTLKRLLSFVPRRRRASEVRAGGKTVSDVRFKPNGEALAPLSFHLAVKDASRERCCG
ncbi:hypothetical protein [Pelagibius sp. Alg239-R121]|uniref:hypothetical protein n=1 Tax=Pelagibius sp. Alg239-R121 TaxID=2993448 RepID=UPI0024A6A6B8|nr:hypothetical protein [Pelagibius sp. Alg239-R121]